MRKFMFFTLLLFGLTSVNSQVRTEVAAEQNWYQPDSIIIKKKNHWIKPAIAIAYPVATYLCYKLLDTQIQDESQEGKTTFKSFCFNSIGDLGLGRNQAIAWGGTTVIAFASGNKKLEKTVINWAGSLVINSIVTDELKKTFQRHRPSTGEAYNVFDWRGGPKINSSFPSAHTSNAFTTATVFATMYKDHKWVPPVAYGLATLVGISRLYNNAHWASDVMAGAAVGFLSAKAMNGLYKWAGKKITFLPQVGVNYSSLGMVYQF
jgi:membrane-associated phospholipid phosphatase